MTTFYPGEPGGMIDREWWSFTAAAIPSTAGPVQRQEMRRAFYAGALAVLHGLMESLDPGDEPTAEDFDRMSRLEAELQAFGEAIQRGEA